MRRRRYQLLAIALAAATSAGAFARSAGAQVSDDALEAGRVASEQIAIVARQMVDPAGDQDARDIAARKLLSIDRAEARNAVAAALAEPANPGGRLAAARAVADDLRADPAFVDSLFVLLDATQPRALIDAAAVALGNYKAQPEITARLVLLTDPQRPETVRLAAIRALSTQIEKRAGQQLMTLTGDSTPAVAAAAIEALQTFASLPLTTEAEWADWWRAQADTADDRFRLDLLTARAARFEQQARRGDDTYQELRRSVLGSLDATPRDQLADALTKLLRSPRDATRLIAVRQANALALTGDLPAGARSAVRELVADPSPDVRIEAARATPVLNDPDAFVAIARQVVVEPDARVRAELARAAGPVGNAAAVPVLTLLLDDPAPPVVQAAAASLAGLGATLAEQAPARAAELADRLLPLARSRTGQVREAVVQALVALKQRSLRPEFSRMLSGTSPREPDSIRRLAAAGLAGLADPANADLLAESLGDESAAVRLEIVRALGASSNDFALVAPSLYRRMDPGVERDEAVRTEAWNVLRRMLNSAPREQLAAWPELAVIRNDAAKRLVLFVALAGKAETAGDRDGQSLYLQQAGDAQMTLAQSAQQAGDSPAATARFAEATASYRQALTISRDQKRWMVVDRLIESTLQSMLRAKDYAGATKFANELFAEANDRGYQGTVGYHFQAEAERLARQVGEYDEALRLIRTAVAIPALPAQYRDHLLDIERDVIARQRERNDRFWFDPKTAFASAD